MTYTLVIFGDCRTVPAASQTRDDRTEDGALSNVVLHKCLLDGGYTAALGYNADDDTLSWILDDGCTFYRFPRRSH